jgi:hypothetical protein
MNWYYNTRIEKLFLKNYATLNQGLMFYVQIIKS